MVIVTILTAGRSKKALTEEIFSGSAPSGAGAFRSSAGLSIFSFLMIGTFSLCGSSSVSSFISSIFCPFPVFSPASGGSCSASGGICSVSEGGRGVCVGVGTGVSSSPCSCSPGICVGRLSPGLFVASGFSCSVSFVGDLLAAGVGEPTGAKVAVGTGVAVGLSSLSATFPITISASTLL